MVLDPFCILLTTLCGCLAACAYTPKIEEGFRYEQAYRWRKSLPHFGEKIKAKELYEAYVRHYQLPTATGHSIGYIDLREYRIAVQRFVPVKPQGVAIFCHGYPLLL